MRHETLSIKELTVQKIKPGEIEGHGRKVLEMMSASIAFQGGSAVFGTVPKGATIHKIEVAVGTAFNGTGASLLIGKSGDTDAYAAAGDIDETSATVQNVYPGATLTADTKVFATLTDPDGTTGAATMLLYYTL